MISAEDGAYAWDVPEGLWQVRCEKEGYEAACSEWLQVPPPQLGINIPMKKENADVKPEETQSKSHLEKTYKRFRLPDSVRAKQKVQKSKEQNSQVKLCYD